MKRLVEIDSAYCEDIKFALEEESYSGPSKVGELRIVECTYDLSADAGYLYCVYPIGKGGVSETLAFASPYWFNIDLGLDREILGIEVFHRRDFVINIAAKSPARLREFGEEVHTARNKGLFGGFFKPK
jgi:uncharacterized protein YuzE